MRHVEKRSITSSTMPSNRKQLEQHNRNNTDGDMNVDIEMTKATVGEANVHHKTWIINNGGRSSRLPHDTNQNQRWEKLKTTRNGVSAADRETGGALMKRETRKCEMHM